MNKMFISVAISSILLAAPTVHAGLPALLEKPWMGYFIGLKERRLQFGLSSTGEGVLYALDRRGEIHAASNPIKVKYEVLETMPDGKVVSKRVDSDSLTSEHPAAEDPKGPVTVDGKVTGGAAFRLIIAPERGGYSMTGKITDKGELTNPLEFVITIDFDPYQNGPGEGEDAVENFEKKIKRDEFRFTTTDREKEKVEFLDKVNPAKLHEKGFTEAELRTEGYGGVTFQLEATGKSKMVFEDKGEKEFWTGFSPRWSVNEDGDPSQAKLIVTAK